MRIKPGILACMISLAAGLLTAGAGQANAPAAAAEGQLEVIPSPMELFSLYQGRTWTWEAGGAYFAPRPRTFVAWSKTGADESYAEGRWIITTDGQVCFKANWHSRGSVVPALTCFAHKSIDGTIYQRRLPNGDWYLFKSPNLGEAQEYAKFKPGDEVSGPVADIRLALRSTGN